MVAYTKPQQRKKEESERLRGEEGDQIKFIDLRFERWQVVGFRKGRRRQYVILYRNGAYKSQVNRTS